MKVRDIIEASGVTWSPRRSVSSKPPRLSIFLPTYRRGKDGMLARAIDSILAQSFDDWELIIVDDGSQDGTLEQTLTIRDRDPRVAVLRHEHNIGLPAISEFEAFERSTGEHIAFAFDDFVFQPTAFERLWNAAQASNASFVRGIAELALPGPNGGDTVMRRYGGGRNLELLREANFIANASVLLRRDLLEHIGLYDPHVVLARLCDWDLWLRAMMTTELLLEDVLVGTEYGVAQTGSLGRSYPINYDAARERFACARNHLLLPSRFLDYDVFELLPDASALSRAFRAEMAQFFATRHWRAAPVAAERAPGSDRQGLPQTAKFRSGSDNGREVKRVLILSTGDASTAFCFDWIDDSRILPLPVFAGVSSQYIYHLMVNASALIVCRELSSETTLTIITLARAMRVKLIYYIDDNLIELSKELPYLAFFGSPEFRQRLSSFATVLVTNEALQSYFLREKLHADVRVIRPSFVFSALGPRPERTERQDGDELRVAFLGNIMRFARFTEIVLPALERVAATTAIRLIVGRRPDDEEELEAIRQAIIRHNARADRGCLIALDAWPLQQSVYQLIQRLRASAIDIVVHPGATSVNQPYKVDTIVLVSAAAGAVPVVDAEPAFAALSEADGVVRVSAESAHADWYAALSALADPAYRARMAERTEDFARRAYAPKENESLWAAIGAELEPVNYARAMNRVYTLIVEREMSADTRRVEREERLQRLERLTGSRSKLFKQLLRALWRKRSVRRSGSAEPA